MVCFIWSAKTDHIASKFLKTIFQKFHLVHSWFLCLNYLMFLDITAFQLAFENIGIITIMELYAKSWNNAFYALI